MFFALLCKSLYMQVILTPPLLPLLYTLNSHPSPITFILSHFLSRGSLSYLCILWWLFFAIQVISLLQQNDAWKTEVVGGVWQITRGRSMTLTS